MLTRERDPGGARRRRRARPHDARRRHGARRRAVRARPSQTDDLITQLEASSRHADALVREVDRARRATGIGSSFPIAGYDDLTAAQVGERLDDLSAPELRKVRDYERRNANRKSVLAAIERKLG